MEDNKDNSPYNTVEDIAIEQALKESDIKIPQELTTKIVSSEACPKDVDKSSTKEMNDFFVQKYAIYNNVLAPQLTKNEELKRQHKTNLMNKLLSLLKWQFVATYLLMFIVVIIVSISKFLNLSEMIITEMFSFFKYYITTIVAELIAILFFIIKQVFDTSIADLFKNFDKNSSKK